MVGKAIREIRCDDVLQAFMRNNEGLVFMTLTTKDVVTIHEIRERWRSLRHYLVELYGKKAKYVMNYELHPMGHGWHIHAVWNRFIPLWGSRLSKIQSFGFGRVNVKKVTSHCVSLYLTKHCLKAYRGVKTQLKTEGGKRLRLVNSSRGLPVLSDYRWSSPDLEAMRKLMRTDQFKKLTKHLPFSRRCWVAEMCVFEGCSVRHFMKKTFGHEHIA